MTDASSSELDELVSSGIIAKAAYERAASLSNLTGTSIELALNQMGALSDDALADLLHQRTKYPIFSITNLPEAAILAEQVNADFLRKHRALPIQETDEKITVGFVDPENIIAISGLAFSTGKSIDPVILKAGDWKQAWSKLYEAEVDLSGLGDTASTELLAGQDRDAPIVRKVSTWLSDAADMGASDIHFEARQNGLDVRYRVDGTLRHITTESADASSSIIARLKVLSSLDLGERRKPQDGRATLVLRGRKLDVRTSIVPSLEGESAVLRLLDRPEGLLTLETLGFDSATISKLKSITTRKEGLFLISGPTGSGKTTTLYACLETLKDKGLKILSVEDPVEYQFDHVTQVQVSEKAGVGFAETLRAFLRHDPEVILVGEIRDAETARTAVQAAFTGHLVLASIHAIDAARVRDRLEDMGVESFKLDACLIGSMAQRLTRKLCETCKTSRPVQAHEASLFEEAGLTPPQHVYEPKGCAHCRGDGYRGRLAVSELLLRKEEAPESLRAHGLRAVAAGKTSLANIIAIEAL